MKTLELVQQKAEAIWAARESLPPSINLCAGIVLEALILLAGMALLGGLLAGDENSSIMGGHPFWMAIVIVAAHRGVLGGLITAGLATVFFYWGGIPAAASSEMFYEYRAGLVIQPALWILAGLVIGTMSSRQLGRVEEQKNLYSELRAKAVALTDAVEALNNRNLLLERKIVSEESTVSALLQNLPIPASNSTQDVLVAAEPFLSSGVGVARVGVYSRKNGGFERVAGSGPTHFLDISEVNELRPQQDSLSSRPLIVEPIKSGELEEVHGLVVVEYDSDPDDFEDVQSNLRTAIAGFAGYLDQTQVTPQENSAL